MSGFVAFLYDLFMSAIYGGRVPALRGELDSKPPMVVMPHEAAAVHCMKLVVSIKLRKSYDHHY